MNKDDVASYLQIFGDGLLQGSNLFLANPALSKTMRIAGGLMRVGATLLVQGKDPVEHVTRLVDMDAEFNAARSQVDAESEADQGGEGG